MTNQTTVPSTIIQKYCVSLQNKVSELQIYLDDESKILANKDELCETLHKTIGSGGMYGFEELSEKARQCHVELADFSENNAKSPNDLTKEIAELISIMNNIVSDHC